MILGANLILVVLIVVFLMGLIAMAMKDSLIDFVKANFGLLVLLLIFLTLLGVTFHVFHEAVTNPTSKDFLTWLEAKAGEVLAAVMTLIVGVRSAKDRSGDKGGGDSSSTTTTTTQTSSSSSQATPTTIHP